MNVRLKRPGLRVPPQGGDTAPQPPKMRTILCLINSAAYCRPYFEQLLPPLEARGYTLDFALDSHLSDVLYACGRPLPDAKYFTDFCAARLPLQSAFNQEAGPRWSGLFSDFDRFLTMGIAPPLGMGSPLRYQDIPRLLRAYFAEVFDEVRPAAVLYEQVSNSFAIAAHEEASRRRIPFCSIAPARIPGRIEVSMTGALQDHRTLDAIRQHIARDGTSVENRRIAAEYMRTIDNQVPDYMRPGAAGEVLSRMSLRRKYVDAEKFRHLLRAWRYRRGHAADAALAYQHGDPLALSWAYFRRSLARRLRAGRIAPLYQDRMDDRPYLLYPLHFHPEASTSVLAPDFVDELTVIRAIAFRLPSNVVLAVKEHPSAVALQPTNFYRQLAALPNVALLGAHVPVKPLARNSLGVVCVTSTLGFEAAVMNKPVICLGDVLYGYFPNVRMISDYSALDSALNWALSYRPLPDEELLTATAAYAEFTAPGFFDFKAALGDLAALDGMAGLVARRLDASLAAGEQVLTARSL